MLEMTHRDPVTCFTAETECSTCEAGWGWNKALALQHCPCAPSHLGSRARRKQKGLADSQQSHLCKGSGVLPSQEGIFLVRSCWYVHVLNKTQFFPLCSKFRELGASSTDVQD